MIGTIITVVQFCVTDMEQDHIDMEVDHTDMELDHADMELDNTDMELDHTDMELGHNEYHPYYLVFVLFQPVISIPIPLC